MSEPEQSHDNYELKLEGHGVTIARRIDGATASEIIALVMGGPTEVRARTSPTRSGARPSKRLASSTSAKARRKVGSPGIVRDLSLRPDGKQAFIDFAAAKGPANHSQKQTVILFWLTHEAGITLGITADHVNTCYAEARWQRPGDLRNSLQLTSARRGWLDTGDMSDIRLTTRGEDEVLHNLPPASKAK